MSIIERAFEWNVSAEEYHGALDIIGNSSKERFKKNRREFCEVHVEKSRPAPPPTDDLEIGIYTHMALWEPEMWERLSPEPEFASDGKKIDKRKKLHKAELAAWKADHPDAIDREIWNVVQSLLDAIQRSPVAQKLLAHGGVSERSIRWTDEESGINCKSRQDRMFSLGGDVIVDLKTTRHAVNRNSLQKTIQNGGLHRNADFYIRGHHELTGNVPTYVFLFVSKATFQCAACELSQEWLNLGNAENQVLLNQMARCYETGDWFEDFERDVMTLDPPRYAFTNPDVEID